MGLFSESLKDKQARVRAATFKAMTKFLTSIEDEDLVLQYKSQMNGLLDIVVEVLQKDEEQGKESLETLIELTSTFGEIWNDSTEKLIFVCSEVMKNTDFEDGPRQSALEIITSLSEVHAKALKDQAENLKTRFFPALLIMMTQLENQDDLEAWFEVPEEDIIASNDLASHAAESLERLADRIGEKTTLACTT